MKGENPSRGRNLLTLSSCEDKSTCSDDLSWSDVSEDEGSVSDSGSSLEDRVVSINSEDAVPSLYQRAAEHIITERVLPRSWFRRKPTVEAEIQELAQIVDGLLEAYEEYFNNLIKKEPWCESRGESDFKKIADEVLNRDEVQANWTRIAMLFALATRVARHFYQKGSSRESVVKFSRAIGLCIEQRINSWEDRGDRWEKLRQDAASKPSKTYTPLFGAGAVFVSFLAVVAQFTMTTPIFINRLKT